MEGKPRCKKCGRVLKSPASIARGLGSVCAGAAGGRGKTFRAGMKRSSKKAYPSVGLGERQVPLVSDEMSPRPLSRRELVRRRREERRQFFETRQPFQCGLLMPKRKPLMYEPLEDGNWQENPSGRVISHERLQKYLRKYQFI